MDKKYRFTNSKGVACWLLPLITGILVGALLHSYILPGPIYQRPYSQGGSILKLMAGSMEHDTSDAVNCQAVPDGSTVFTTQISVMSQNLTVFL